MKVNYRQPLLELKMDGNSHSWGNHHLKGSKIFGLYPHFSGDLHGNWNPRRWKGCLNILGWGLWRKSQLEKIRLITFETLLGARALIGLIKSTTHFTGELTRLYFTEWGFEVDLLVTAAASAPCKSEVPLLLSTNLMARFLSIKFISTFLFNSIEVVVSVRFVQLQQHL